MSRYPRQEDSLDDPFVRSTYRGVACERTSEALDDAVLANARAALHARRSPGSGVARPLAWAATVGLCIAIVLQVTLVPADRQPAQAGAPPVGLHESAVELRARKLGDMHREKAGPAAKAFMDDAVSITGGCTVDVRSSRTTWLRCIEDLEAAGHAEVAAAELAQLRDAYPAPAPPSE